MIKGLLLVITALAAVQGDPVALSSRQGTSNSYYLFKSYEDRGVPMPTLKDFENDKDLVFAPLISNHETVVVVHGHGGDWESTLNPGVKNGIFDPEVRPNAQYNVIVVDWSDYTKQSYSDASAAVVSVGRALGEYLKILGDQNRISNDLHLVGFNLGAHVVGIAGRFLKPTRVVPRITGLDPSGSGWGSSSSRLTKGDATYVEVIHTDGNGLFANGIGTAIGDVDFFVNGGSNQPGCATRACCHRRAYELFIVTLTRDPPLQGSLCNNNLQLTMNLCRSSPILPVGGLQLTKPHGSGNVYRVNTGRTPPF